MKEFVCVFIIFLWIGMAIGNWSDLANLERRCGKEIGLGAYGAAFVVAPIYWPAMMMSNPISRDCKDTVG